MKAKRQSKKHQQKLRDAVSYAASCLKEAGEPLHGLGPSQPYANAFDRYGRALLALLSYECALHMADWHWDGYAGTFHFYWEFGAQLAQPGVPYEHDTRFVEARCGAEFDPQKSLDEELTRLHAEAEHYGKLRGVMMRWASERAKVPS